MSVLLNRSVAVAAAFLLDRVTPEPPNRWHPVAWFGSTMSSFEQRVWADSTQRGATYTAVGLSLGVIAGRLLRSTTAATTIALGAASLRSVATNIGDTVARGDLEAARDALPALVGRDPSDLDESGVASAVVESVAENCVDAVIAPMFWGLVFGAPGALGYRAVNTMDAMVGHHNDRFERFGWASARLDDAANWLPARLFAFAVWATTPSRRDEILRAVREDAPAHPSPNAGVAEAAVAGAIDIQLGGTLRYGERVEHRPLLGSGSRPTAGSIRAATRTTDRATMFLSIAAVLSTILLRRRAA